MVTIPWCSKMRRNIIAHVALDYMELFIMLLEKKRYFYSNEVKEMLQFVHLNEKVTDCKLELLFLLDFTLLHFTAFIQFLLVLVESPSLATLRLTAWICTNRKMKRATWGMMFFVINDKLKKKKRTYVWSKSVMSYFFLVSSGLNDITVQLLVGKCGWREDEQGWFNSPFLPPPPPPRLPPSLNCKNCQVQLLNNMVRLHKVLLPFYSNFVLFYQHYKALLYVYFLFSCILKRIIGSCEFFFICFV